MKYWLDDYILGRYSRFKMFFRNAWKFRKTLTESFWFDVETGHYQYLYTQIDQFIKAYDNGDFVWEARRAKKSVQKARIAREYLRRLINGIDLYDNYDLEIVSKESDITPFFRTVSVISTKKYSEVPNDNSKFYKKIQCEYSKKFYRKELYKLLEKYADGWWD